ncbi:hypothetical protein ADUPG1_009787 [Aduncisulcus paluster]|uniref:Uncharacterized protein n=1 Tax=Aduncisulcus paluster TaxID=2918883 RepID=A0ABQ5KWR8_9EUKA|nr:hypothetical protein ADUPG1_009787 [Aduncisulcus paluster]
MYSLKLQKSSGPENPSGRFLRPLCGYVFRFILIGFRSSFGHLKYNLRQFSKILPNIYMTSSKHDSKKRKSSKLPCSMFTRYMHAIKRSDNTSYLTLRRDTSSDPSPSSSK